MTYRTAYWDDEAGEMRERDCTPDEIAEIEARNLSQVTPAVIEAQAVAAYMDAVQQHMDAAALSFGYDNLISVISYADEPAVPRYQSEGLLFRPWRSLVWARCEALLAEIKGGTRPIPTNDELIALLPAAPTK